ncbi:MAG: glycosyltransferase family 2 protein [Pseudomonadota bacterium]
MSKGRYRRAFEWRGRCTRDAVNDVVMQLAVIIATLGRKPVVTDLLRHLAAQSRTPDEICIVVARPGDAPEPEERAIDCDVLQSPRIGLCAQRNAGLDHVSDRADIILFFDDDFIPSPDYLENLEAIFEANPGVAGVTGRVLMDGVKGPGLSPEEALAAISAWRAPAPDAVNMESRNGLYGCNMAYRGSAVGARRFDEKLPLYGWLEDADFSARVREDGAMVWTDRLAGVHLGTKAGRTSGLRFGYSQLMNPIYLHRKGTMPISQAANNIMRNVLSNHARLLFPERHIDRAGRVRGNWLALMDLMRGRLTPEHVVNL